MKNEILNTFILAIKNIYSNTKKIEEENNNEELFSISKEEEERRKEFDIQIQKKKELSKKINQLITLESYDSILELMNAGYKLENEDIVTIIKLNNKESKKIIEYIKQNIEEYNYLSSYLKEDLNVLLEGEFQAKHEEYYVGNYIVLGNKEVECGGWNVNKFLLLNTFWNEVTANYIPENLVNAKVNTVNLTKKMEEELFDIKKVEFCEFVKKRAKFINDIFNKNEIDVIAGIKKEFTEINESIEDKIKDLMKKEITENIHIEKDHQKIVDEIKDVFEKINKFKDDIDDYSRYENLYNKQMPEIIKNYLAIPVKYRDSLVDKDGVSGKELCAKGLSEILEIFKLKINEININKIGDKITNLRVQNKLLKEFKSTM